MPTLGDRLPVSSVLMLAVGCFRQRPYLLGVTTRLRRRAFSLSLSTLPGCSATRKYRVLTSTEARGIRYTEPPGNLFRNVREITREQSRGYK